MVQLVLSLGSSSCTLSSSDLENYPDSLLATVSATSSNMDSSSKPPSSTTAIKAEHLHCSESCITLKLDDLPNNPFITWPEALQLVPSMYREGHIPVALLEQYLKQGQQAAAGSDEDAESSSSAIDYELPLYRKLADLVAFLNLPGPVLNWLPITDMELRHVGSHYFFEQCIAFEAVDNIMSYKPYRSAAGGLNTAAVGGTRLATFLIINAPPPGSSSSFSLHVQVVEPSSPESILSEVAASDAQPGSWLDNALDFGGFCLPSALRIGSSPAATLPQSRAASSNKCVLDLPFETIISAAVGADHPVLGTPLANAMAAAVSITPYVAGHCNVRLVHVQEVSNKGRGGGRGRGRGRGHAYEDHQEWDIPVWFVKW